MKNSFVFYKSYYDAIKTLDKKNAKKLVIAIFDYAFEGVEPELDDPIVKAMFILIKHQIDTGNLEK
jgi:hypothetical protein